MGKMMLISAALLALAQSVYGQATSEAVSASTSTLGSPTASSTRAAATWKISVGINDQFTPDVTTALPGDLLEFDFMPLNHSVVRAEYKYPCIPYEKTGQGKVGFFSGFHPVDTILPNPPTWNIRVNDSNPIFIYCSAPGACITHGMVAVINPNASVSLATQKQMALDSAFMLQPGEDFPPEQSSTSLPTSTSASSTSSSTSTSQTAAAATAIPSSHKSGLPAGAIAGIAVGAVAVLALAAALFFFIGRTKTLQESVQQQRQSDTAPLGGKPDSMYKNPGAPSPGYFPVHPPDFQRYSQVSNGAHGDAPPYGGTPNQSQYPKLLPGQPGWSSPNSRGSANGSPPPNLQQQHQQQQMPQMGQQQQYYSAQPGGMVEQPQPRSPIMGMGRKTSEARGPHEMYASVPKDGHEV